MIQNGHSTPVWCHDKSWEAVFEDFLSPVHFASDPCKETGRNNNKKSLLIFEKQIWELITQFASLQIVICTTQGSVMGWKELRDQKSAGAEIHHVELADLSTESPSVRLYMKWVAEPINTDIHL